MFWRTLARNTCSNLLGLPSRLHSDLHGPLTIAHCHPSSATIGCTPVVAGAGVLLAQTNMNCKPSTLFPQLRHVAGGFSACRLVCLDCCAIAHLCTWVPTILTYLGNFIFQIASPPLHCYYNDYGALMLLHLPLPNFASCKFDFAYLRDWTLPMP